MRDFLTLVEVIRTLLHEVNHDVELVKVNQPEILSSPSETTLSYFEDAILVQVKILY